MSCVIQVSEMQVIKIRVNDLTYQLVESIGWLRLASNMLVSEIR